MIIIPTADLRGSSVYAPADGRRRASEPLDAFSTYRTFASIGFRRMHLHQLDGDARTDLSDAFIAEFARDSSLELVVSAAQLPDDRLERLLEAGVGQFIVAADAGDIEEVARLADAFPDCLIVRADSGDETFGRRAGSRRRELDTIDLAAELSSLPIAGVAVHMLSPDGFLGCPLNVVEELVDISTAPVFCRTDVSTVGELRALEHIGVAATLLGASLYSGRLDVRALAQHFDS